MNTHRFFLLCSLAFILSSRNFAADAPSPASGAAANSAQEKIKVRFEYVNGSESTSLYDGVEVEAPNGTPILEAAKLAGLASLLTDKARLEIRRTKDGTDWQTTNEDVAAVRAGKAKDGILEKNFGDKETIVSISYKDFEFPGGQPSDFVRAVKSQFGCSWPSVEIPETLMDARIPAFRKEDAEDMGSGSNVYNVIKLYNTIGARYPGIGKWAWDGNILKPNIIMLTPDEASKSAANGADVAMKVKAFPLAYIRPAKWQSLELDIQRTADVARSFSEEANRGKPDAVAQGMVTIQRDSEILVALGSQNYIDMVESIMMAYEKNEKVNNVGGPAADGK